VATAEKAREARGQAGGLGFVKGGAGPKRPNGFHFAASSACAEDEEPLPDNALYRRFRRGPVIGEIDQSAITRGKPREAGHPLPGAGPPSARRRKRNRDVDDDAIRKCTLTRDFGGKDDLDGCRES